MPVWLRLALRCIHTYPPQRGSYCEQTYISGEIAAVLKLLLLQDLQGKMVCNSHPALPLCCACCWRCFHTALSLASLGETTGGHRPPRTISAIFPPSTLEIQKKLAGNEKKALPLPRAPRLLCFHYSRHVCYLFSPSPLPPSFLVLYPSNGSLMQYAVLPRLSVNEADEYSWGGGWYGSVAIVDACVHRLCGGHVSEGSLVRRHQGPLGSSANDADVRPGILFWLVNWRDDPFPRPLLSPWWPLAELKFSLQLPMEDGQETREWEKKLPLSRLPTVLLILLFLLFLPVALTCDKQMPWAASLGIISILLLEVSLFLATSPSFNFLCLLYFTFLGHIALSCLQPPALLL